MRNKQAWQRYLRWRGGDVPNQVPRDELLSVLEEFFPGQFKAGGREPNVVTHRAVLALRRFAGMPPAIPEVSGRLIKRRYVENVVYMVGWIRIWREFCRVEGLDEFDESDRTLALRERLAAGYEQGQIRDGQIEGN